MAAGTPRRVVVVGGGISGLAAAWELSGGAIPSPDTPSIVVMEASDRLGGVLRTAEFGGRLVDVGPDGFLSRRPEAVDLCRELDLGDDLVPIAGRGAGVWARGQLRMLPDGLALGIPTRFWPPARSGILGLRGQLGLALDTLAPRPDRRGPIGDRSIGPLVARKLGQRVVDVLVDPLIGGIHAGSVDDMSTAATYPPLLAAAQRRGSLMRALRAEVPTPSPDAPPLFFALGDGMAALAHRLDERLRQRGADIRRSSPVEQLVRVGSRWEVRAGGVATEADAVLLALPAAAAGRLLADHDDEAAALLDGIDSSSVALVTFRFPADALAAPLRGTGYLVPRHGRRGRHAEDWAVTACTYLDQKWPHLAREGEVLLRASLGRKDDARFAEWSDTEVSEQAWGELGAHMGLSGHPSEAMVVRYPDAFPQYRVHHLLRTAGIEAAVARLGGLAVAGAAYRGVGIPACIASGRAAARALL
jgi:oxygen-dependent protoporphyrinogen oxidase